MATDRNESSGSLAVFLCNILFIIHDCTVQNGKFRSASAYCFLVIPFIILRKVVLSFQSVDEIRLI